MTAGLLVLGGCGDDDDSGGAASDASTSIAAEAADFEFDPDAWTVPVDEEITIDFENAGNIEHEWAVLALGQEIESEADFSEEIVLFEVEAIPPGESTSESFTVDEAGTYQVICALEGHFDAGMEGALEVAG
ncbi:MAG TPA: cupredoxin domain-containing protein [Acidimicrobiales bacterium]|nr:cupredoxin domain-containing protein [Acidimicrobiales bacterium]